jgi:hypothetical protein
VSLIWLFALASFTLGVESGISRVPALFLFTVSSAIATTLVICRPYSPFMMSLVLFFALGFWVKFVFHTLFNDVPWGEPIGRFSGVRDEWTTVLYVASAAMLATILPALAIRKASPPPCSVAGARRFALAEPWLWSITLIVGLSLFALNYQLAFLRVGIDTRTILLFPFNAVLSFLLTYGIAIGVACVGYWSWSAGHLPMQLLIAMGIVEGALSSWSTLSRVQIILHSGAFLMGWALYARGPRAGLRLNASLALTAFFAVAFAVSTIAVSLDRIVTYGTPADLEAQQSNVTADTSAGDSSTPSPEAALGAHVIPEQSESGRGDVVTSKALSDMVAEVGRLFVDRWIGLEGIMSTVAYDGKDLPLLMFALSERPSVGNEGIYEFISASPYRKLPGRTFLTIPGCAAVLYYSGSALIVFLGIMSLCFAAIALERFALWATESPFAMAVIGVAAANSIAQLNHPYALFTLWVQLFMACGAIYVLRRCVLGPDVSVERSQV